MARARNIKPAFFKNELLGQADPFLSLLFISLWTLADREGRLEDRPLRIKAETFPYRDVSDFNGYLTQLEQHGFIERYKVGDSAIIQIVNFRKHQAPHNTEKPSELPEKPIDTPITVKATLDTDGSTQAKRPDSLIPDSLIPDSLNTDSLIADSRQAAKKSAHTMLTELGVEDQPAKDWLTIRKAKRAPLTQTALDDLVREAGKAGISVNEAVTICARRSWQGFNASWDWKGRGSVVATESANDQAREAARKRLFGEEEHAAI